MSHRNLPPRDTGNVPSLSSRLQGVLHVGAPALPFMSMSTVPVEVRHEQREVPIAPQWDGGFNQTQIGAPLSDDVKKELKEAKRRRDEEVQRAEAARAEAARAEAKSVEAERTSRLEEFKANQAEKEKKAAGISEDERVARMEREARLKQIVEDDLQALRKAAKNKKEVSPSDAEIGLKFQDFFSEANTKIPANDTFRMRVTAWLKWNSTEPRSNYDDFDIASWITTGATDMSNLFKDATTFNEDISGWDVSNVTTMEGMFRGATNFNQNLSKWNVSNVTTMEGMFQGATAFIQDLSSWNVSNVTNFKNFTSFQTDGELTFKKKYNGQLFPPRPTVDKIFEQQTRTGKFNVLNSDTIQQTGSYGSICFRIGCISPRVDIKAFKALIKPYAADPTRSNVLDQKKAVHMANLALRMTPPAQVVPTSSTTPAAPALINENAAIEVLRTAQQALKLAQIEAKMSNTPSVFVAISTSVVCHDIVEFLGTNGFKFYVHKDLQLDDRDVFGCAVNAEYVYVLDAANSVPSYATSIEGVHAVIFSNDLERVLLVFERNMWSTPGGAVDIGESLIGALERELKEELNVEIDPDWPGMRILACYQEQRARDNLINDNHMTVAVRMKSNVFTPDGKEILRAQFYRWRPILDAWRKDKFSYFDDKNKTIHFNKDEKLGINPVDGGIKPNAKTQEILFDTELLKQLHTIERGLGFDIESKEESKKGEPSRLKLKYTPSIPVDHALATIILPADS